MSVAPTGAVSTHSALYIGPAELERLLGAPGAPGPVTPADCVAAVEASFREHGEAQVEVLPRQILWAEAAPKNQPRSPRSRALKLSASYMQGSKRMGASIYSTHFRPGDMDMWLTVFCGEDGPAAGKMLGVLHGNALSLWKTAATAAVAAKHLARADARRAALIGTGHYARTQLLCLAAVRPLESVRVFSRDAAKRDAFVQAMRTELPGIDIRAAASARAAVAEADIVTTITTSAVPVLEGAWLAPGTHVNAMGQHAPHTREIDTPCVRDARVIVDAFEQAFNEKGELLIPIAEGAIGRDHAAGELGAVVSGRVAGRRAAAGRTVFLSGGTALEYMGLCDRLIELARAAGIGIELPG